MSIMLKGIRRAIMMASLTSAFLLMGINTSYAKWEIEYSDWLISAMSQAGHPISKRVGSFDNRATCEQVRQQAIAQSGDPSLAMHMQCVGFDEPSQQGSYVPSYPSYTGPKEEERIQRERKRKEAAEKERLKREQEKQKAYEREKAELLGKLKGVSSEGDKPELKTGGTGTLQLKPYSNPRSSASTAAPSVDVQQINKRIEEIQRYIAGIQTLLRGYSRTLHGNRTEFEKWESTVNQAYNEVIDSSKEYVMQMFLKYNLFGALERSAQKSLYSKLGAYLGSDDPTVSKWLLEKIRVDQIQFSRLKKVVDVGNLSGDFASLISGDRKETKKNLDALLFVNSLLETGEIVKYKPILEKSRIFRALPGEYFTQAKMIGETYANLSAIAYSWYSIDKLTNDLARYDREINSLGYRMRRAMKEMECLKGCLELPTDRCMDRCAGKTSLSKPPPLPL